MATVSPSVCPIVVHTHTYTPVQHVLLILNTLHNRIARKHSEISMVLLWLLKVSGGRQTKAYD